MLWQLHGQLNGRVIARHEARTFDVQASLRAGYELDVTRELIDDGVIANHK